MARSDIDKLRDYASRFPKEVEQECLVQVKKMRNKGFGYEWIYKAISHKDQSEWAKWGFGLLHMESYQSQINKLMAKEKQQLESIDVEGLSWDSLADECDDAGAGEVEAAEAGHGETHAQEPASDEEREEVRVSFAKPESIEDRWKAIVEELSGRFEVGSPDFDYEYEMALFEFCFPKRSIEDDELTNEKEIEDDAFAARCELGFYEIRQWDRYRWERPEEAKERVKQQKRLRLITGLFYSERCERQRFFDGHKLWDDLEHPKRYPYRDIYCLLSESNRKTIE